MSEAQLMDAIAELAQVRGFMVHHQRPARTAEGWRSAVAYDGRGWPDLVIVGHGRCLIVEVKSDKGKVTLEQHAWLDLLRDTCVEVYVIRPADWRDGTVEAVLS
jgi:hypothetical protein